jgi:glyoxylase-like metal-dependent hydrolase (beta-lactamase superfamily II)
MAQIKILVEGYAKNVGGKEFASSTVVLIRESGLNIIVDSGSDKKMLLEGMAKENLKIEDINYVILTHTHLDHCLLAGIFCNAGIFDNSEIYSFDGKIVAHGGLIPETDIEIIKTPGHDQFHCSVLANTKDLGKVAIAGDVFWWGENEKQETDLEGLLGHKDAFVKDEGALRKSREKILGIADYIIPGHGKMFKAPI